MGFRFPGLEIREPLKPRPIAGGVIGTLAGVVFAVLADTGRFDVSRNEQTIGFIAGGAVAGVIVGFCALMFRTRLKAGLVIWLAASTGLLIANRAWREFPDPLGSVVLGFIVASVYATVFWDYRAETTHDSK